MKTTVIAVADNKGGVAKPQTAGNVGYRVVARFNARWRSKLGMFLTIDRTPGQSIRLWRAAVSVRAALRNVLDKLGDVSTLKDNIVSLIGRPMGPRPKYVPHPRKLRIEYTTEDLVLRQLSKRNNGFSLRRCCKMPSPHHRPFPLVSSLIAPKLDVLKRTVYNFADEVIVPVKVDYMRVLRSAAAHQRPECVAFRDRPAEGKAAVGAALRCCAPASGSGEETLAAMVKLLRPCLHRRPYSGKRGCERISSQGQSLLNTRRILLRPLHTPNL